MDTNERHSNGRGSRLLGIKHHYGKWWQKNKMRSYVPVNTAISLVKESPDVDLCTADYWFYTIHTLSAFHPLFYLATSSAKIAHHLFGMQFSSGFKEAFNEMGYHIILKIWCPLLY